jgi:membrane protease subunit HflC
VTKFDKRLLRIDAAPASLLTKDKRNLVIDAYARYKIEDPILFFRLLRNEIEADSRVSDVVASALRREVALDDQTEIISDTREEIMRRVTTASNRQEISREEAMELDGGLRNDDLIFLIDEADPTNARVVRQRLATADERLALISIPEPLSLGGKSARYAIPLRLVLGIEIVDVRIKRADFPAEIEESVFARMRAERLRIASGLRAEGARSDAEIRADVDKEVQIIRERAEGTSSELRGEGEGEAITILADALEKDPDFFAFQRSLEAYRKTMATNTTVVLSAGSPLFRFLESPDGLAGQAR